MTASYPHRRGSFGAYYAPGAIDPARYRRVWTFKVPREYINEGWCGYPLIWDGRVYGVLDHPVKERLAIVSLDLQSGQPLWTVSLSKEFAQFGNPTVGPKDAFIDRDGIVVVSQFCNNTSCTGFCARVSHDGVTELLFKRNGMGEIAVSRSGRGLFSVSPSDSPNHELTAILFDLGGHVLAEACLSGDTGYDPILGTDSALASTRLKEREGRPREEHANVIDLKSGRVIASVSHGLDYVYGDWGAVLHNEFIGQLVQGPRGTVTGLAALSLRTAEILWTLPKWPEAERFPAKVTYQPDRDLLIHGYASSYSHNLRPHPIVAFRRSDRSEVWRTMTEDHCTLVVTDTHVLGRGGRGAGLSVYDLDSGKRTVLEKKFPAGEAALAGGRLVLTTPDSIVCAAVN